MVWCKRYWSRRISKKIYFDDIKILFDLSGYTANNFLEVFLFKPAPIQISWAGYLSSTGIKEIDYILVDSNVVSKEFSKYFIEKPLALKNTWSLLSAFENIKPSNVIPFLGISTLPSALLIVFIKLIIIQLSFGLQS